MVRLGVRSPCAAAEEDGFLLGHQIAFFPVPGDTSLPGATAHLPRGLWFKWHGLYFLRVRKEGA